MHTTHTTPTRIGTLALGAIVVALCALFVSALQSSAAILRTGSIYTLEEGTPVDGDVYLVGEEVTTRGATLGDVFIAAGSADVNGEIGADALLLGGTVGVSAPVTGDLRVAGGEVFISGSTSEDVFVAGGNVILEEDSYVGGDLLVYADRLELHGKVVGHADIHARTIVVRGSLMGPADIRARESLSIQDVAHIGNGLRYRAPREAMISETAIVEGDVVYEPSEAGTTDVGTSVDWISIMLRALIAIVAGLSLFFIFPTFTTTATRYALSNNGSVVGVGLGVLVIAPFCIVLLFATMVGAIPGLALLLLYGLALVGAFALSSVLAGVILTRWLKKEDTLYWAWISLGAVTLSLITLLPVIGWIVRLLVFLVALGTVCVLAYEGVWARRKSTPHIEHIQPTTSPLVATTHDARSETTTEKETDASK